ncbi:hypothetical protein INS49_005029 [Diaporthe citri]|uniref:uncharacterized protein n=1 Tax=Diaporthe citri TaxID=83186 RepID=UPI001C7ECCE2|nr:uncharacterized protein INS49_005029 [Diaporthe citri]KAG6354058.1 hypothetical protein INS49_005029 [Diaporthe citri]
MFTKAVLFSFLSSSALAGVLNAAHHAAHLDRRAADICGKKGYDRGASNYDYDDSGKFSTLADCSKRCLASSQCLSFGYGGKECMLFSVALANNFDADSGSTDTYYDRGCSILGSQPNPQQNPVKTSTTSKVSTTSKAQVALSSLKTTTPSAVAPTSSTARSLSTSSSPASSISTAIQSSSGFSSSGFSSSTSTSTAPASTVSYYPGCKASDFKQTFDITSLSWFNSTNNLDCVGGKANFDSSAKVCVDSATNTLCDPSKAGSPSTCTCQAYCTPTAPSAAFQPPGYGPPDTISVSIADFAYPTCTQSNPQTPATGVGALGLAEVGGGNVGCGPNHNYLNFFGDSSPGREQGRVLFVPGASCQGHLALYEATFPLSCSRDAGGNATCVPQTLPVSVSLTRFAVGQCNSCSGSLIQ